MVARVVEGEVNPAFGWHEGLEKRVVSHVLPCVQNVAFRMLKSCAAPHVVMSAGRVITQVIAVPKAVAVGDTICLQIYPA